MARPTDSDRVEEIRIKRGAISVRLKEAEIDRLALDFCAVLERHAVKYAIVGGYVAILLGRPRESDDVDIIAREVSADEFGPLHERLVETFDCHAAGRARELYLDYLAAGAESTALRYARRGSFVPNVEFKFGRKTLDHRALARRVPVELNGQRIFVGPLELQIAYKLYMRGPKDFEDARWIYRVARESLDETEIWRTAKALGFSAAQGRRILGID